MGRKDGKLRNVVFSLFDFQVTGVILPNSTKILIKLVDCGPNISGDRNDFTGLSKREYLGRNSYIEGEVPPHFTCPHWEDAR